MKGTRLIGSERYQTGLIGSVRYQTCLMGSIAMWRMPIFMLVSRCTQQSTMLMDLGVFCLVSESESPQLLRDQARSGHSVTMATHQLPE